MKKFKNTNDVAKCPQRPLPLMYERYKKHVRLKMSTNTSPTTVTVTLPVHQSKHFDPIFVNSDRDDFSAASVSASFIPWERCQFPGVETVLQMAAHG